MDESKKERSKRRSIEVVLPGPFEEGQPPMQVRVIEKAPIAKAPV